MRDGEYLRINSATAGAHPYMTYLNTETESSASSVTIVLISSKTCSTVIV